MKKSREKVRELKDRRRGFSYGQTEVFEGRGGIISVVIAVIFTAILFAGCNEQEQAGYVYPARFFAKELKAEAIEVIRKSLSDSDPQVRANAAEVVAALHRPNLGIAVDDRDRPLDANFIGTFAEHHRLRFSRRKRQVHIARTLSVVVADALPAWQ